MVSCVENYLVSPNSYTTTMENEQYSMSKHVDKKDIGVSFNNYKLKKIKIRLEFALHF
jgi:hypothetical protein